MYLQSIFIFISAISISVSANSELCLKGCCGLALKLPSTSLTLHHLTIEKSSIQVPLQASELPCCPCGDQVVLQSKISLDDITGCPEGLFCNNGTTISPSLPSTPEPKDPVVKPPFPKSPAGIHKNPCAEGQCWTDCECGSRLASPKILNASVKASVATLQQVGTKKNPCGEDLPCDGACECSTSILLSLISPDTPMASLPRVCGPQECSADCICRDDLIKTAKVVASLREHDSNPNPKVANQKIIAGKSEL